MRGLAISANGVDCYDRQDLTSAAEGGLIQGFRLAHALGFQFTVIGVMHPAFLLETSIKDPAAFSEQFVLDASSPERYGHGGRACTSYWRKWTCSCVPSQR